MSQWNTTIKLVKDENSEPSEISWGSWHANIWTTSSLSYSTKSVTRVKKKISELVEWGTRSKSKSCERLSSIFSHWLFLTRATDLAENERLRVV